MTPLVSSGQVSASAPPAGLTTHSLVTSPTLAHAHLAAMYSPAYSDTPTPYPLPSLGGEQSAFYSPAAAAGLEIKESLAGSPLAPAWSYPSMYYPYESLATYPFTGYGMGLDAARRKNATREATATLKAWLNEHKKNPYPTKGEKIMLAIITKMTLTQVSTWFANARRRLKKENKMTWEPRSKTDDDDDDDDDKDDDKIDDKDDKDDDDEKKLDKDGLYSDGEDKKKDSEAIIVSGGAAGLLRGTASPGTPTEVLHPKPRIWSLADMATSGGLSSSSSPGSGLSMGAGKIMPGGMTRGLHLEGSPYPRPLFPHAAYPYIPHSVSESFLSYQKTLASFSPAALTENLMSSSLLASSSFVHDFARHEYSRSDVLRNELMRPDLSRHDLSRPELARPEPHRPDPRPSVEKEV